MVINSQQNENLYVTLVIIYTNSKYLSFSSRSSTSTRSKYHDDEPPFPELSCHIRKQYKRPSEQGVVSKNVILLAIGKT